MSEGKGERKIRAGGRENSKEKHEQKNMNRRKKT